MEHTNLFLYETEADFLTDYPEGKMDQPVPGVAYIRGEEGQLGTLHTNREITTYPITIHSTDKSGVTVAQDRVIQTNPVLDGNSVKMNVVAEPVEGYKPRHEVEKVTFTSASTEHTIIYLASTSYTVTVNYVYSGDSIAPSSAVVIDNIFDEDVVRLTIEPVTVAGYSASPVTISVSGDMEYDLEYEVVAPDYEWIDLNLPSGTLWANKNIGASSPEDFGDYYAWGEKATKATYNYDNYSFYDADDDEFTKYNYNDGKFMLDLEDDVAYARIGGEAHVPTYLQFAELLDNCDSALTTVNGINGLLLTARDSSGSDSRNLPSIFFPAAGMYDEEGFNEDAVYVVSNTLDSEDMCLVLLANYQDDPKSNIKSSSPFSGIVTLGRQCGVPVRAVKGEGPAPTPPVQEA